MTFAPAASSGRVASRQPLAVCCKTTGSPSRLHSTTSSPVLGLLPGNRLTATERGAGEASACCPLRLLSHARVAAPAARLICPTTVLRRPWGRRRPQTIAWCGACLRPLACRSSCERCCSYEARVGAHRRGFETASNLPEPASSGQCCLRVAAPPAWPKLEPFPSSLNPGRIAIYGQGQTPRTRRETS